MNKHFTIAINTEGMPGIVDLKSKRVAPFDNLAALQQALTWMWDHPEQFNKYQSSTVDKAWNVYIER